MIKKLFSGLLETCHLMQTAFLFVAAFWTSPFTNPVKHSKLAGEAASSAGRISSEMSDVLLSRGPWVAAGALTTVALVGFLRGDGKKFIALVRLAACAATLLFTLWASYDLPEQYLYRPWNAILGATGVNLLLTAYLVGGGGGGGASKSSGGDDKKK